MSLQKNTLDLIINTINKIPPYKIFNYLNIFYTKKDKEKNIWKINNKEFSFNWNEGRKIYLIKDNEGIDTPVNFYLKMLGEEKVKFLIKNIKDLIKFSKEYKNLKETILQKGREDWGYYLLNLGFKQVERGNSPKYKNRETGEIYVMYKSGEDYLINNVKEMKVYNIIGFFHAKGVVNYREILNELNSPKPKNFKPLQLEERISIEEREKNIENLSKDFANRIKKIIPPVQKNFSYLTNIRKISDDIIQKYIGTGLFNLSVDYYGDIINRFVYLTDKGDFYLSGYQVKGENLRKKKNMKSYTASGSIKTISMLVPNDLTPDIKFDIVMGESYIDALSYIELNKIPSAVIVDTMGMFGEKAQEQFKKLLTLYKNNIAKIHLVFDNDEMGEKYTKTALAISKEMNIPCERITPPKNFKDWNDYLKFTKTPLNIIKKKASVIKTIKK